MSFYSRGIPVSFYSIPVAKPTGDDLFRKGEMYPAFVDLEPSADLYKISTCAKGAGGHRLAIPRKAFPKYLVS